MAVTDYKITDTSGYKMQDIVGDSLSGTVAENKAAFDNLGLYIIQRYNALCDYLDTNVEGKLIDIDDVYPVGSIYISTTSSTSPTSIFGGTWQQVKDKFLLCAGDTYTAGATGGSADAVIPSHTHTITASAGTVAGHKHALTSASINSAGAHTHTTTFYNYSESTTSTNAAPLKAIHHNASTATFATSSAGSHSHTLTGTTDKDGEHTHTITATASTTGVSATGANMPPYLAVYVWKRTA